MFFVVVAFSGAKTLIGRGPSKLADLTIAPTNLLIYVSSALILLKTIALRCVQGKNIQEKHNIFGIEIAHFIFDAVKRRGKKHILLLLLSK